MDSSTAQFEGGAAKGAPLPVQGGPSKTRGSAGARGRPGGGHLRQPASSGLPLQKMHFRFGSLKAWAQLLRVLGSVLVHNEPVALVVVHAALGLGGVGLALVNACILHGVCFAAGEGGEGVQRRGGSARDGVDRRARAKELVGASVACTVQHILSGCSPDNQPTLLAQSQTANAPALSALRRPSGTSSSLVKGRRGRQGGTGVIMITGGREG